MIKQKEAVFAAYSAGIAEGLTHGSPELFGYVASKIETGLLDGTIEYNKSRQDLSVVKSYSKSLTKNWFLRDTRISSVPYTPRTKRGPQIKDERLKELNENLKSLKVHNADMTLIQRVEEAAAARKAEIQASKAVSKVQSIDETMASLERLGIPV